MCVAAATGAALLLTGAPGAALSVGLLSAACLWATSLRLGLAADLSHRRDPEPDAP